jgi:hypothetical protein
MKIVAIGGAVIKTAHKELRSIIEQGKVEMLIHNGASVFHDFQLAIDKNLEKRGITSYPLSELTENFDCNKEASDLVWKYVDSDESPEGSITRLCKDMKIPTLVFTALGTDFWQLFRDDWTSCAVRAKRDFDILCNRMNKPFEFLLMGSAVIHPEVFTKAEAVVHPKNFTADVVDFLEAYRPRTRVAKYGKYYKMTHKDFLINIMGAHEV